MKAYRSSIAGANHGFLRLVVMLTLFAGIPVTTIAQTQANFWYFGKNAALDFNDFDPMPLANSSMDAPEGAACISDSTGKLAFYTDGVNIWNSNHVKINVNPLSGSATSTQSATIVPDPEKPDEYYLFTTKPFITGSPVTSEVNYYKIRIKPGENGEIIEDYSASHPGGLLGTASGMLTEKFVAIPFTYAYNKTGYWFLMHEFNTNRFVKIKLDSIWHDPEYQAIGQVHANDTIDDGTNRGAAGQLKANDIGTRLALAVEGSRFFELFKFRNDSTGLIYSPMKLPTGNPSNKNAFLHYAYGVEFSPTHYSLMGAVNYLYATARDGGLVYRWDLESEDFSDYMLNKYDVIYSNPDNEYGAMQLAPNGKIYIALNGQDFLSVINAPTQYECLFEEKGARLINNDTGLGGLCGLGLPAAVPVIKKREPFFFENLCLGSTTKFHIADQRGNITSRNWIIARLAGGGTVQKKSTSNDFEYVFSLPGKYRVMMVLMKNGKVFQDYRELTINSLPSVNLIAGNTKDTVQLCKGTSLDLDAGSGAFYAWETDTINRRQRTVTTTDGEFYHEYRVLVTDYHGCVGWDTVMVKREIPPTTTHSSVKAFCGRHDGSATVIPNGRLDFFTYEWENYPNEKSNTLSGLNGGDYVVRVTKPSTTCWVNDTIHVDELGGTSIKILHDRDTVCPGETITLKVEGASEVEWVGHPELSGTEVTVTVNSTTVYNIVATSHDDSRDCTTPVAETIHVFPKNTPKLGADLTPCGGNPVKIDGGEQYIDWNWSNGQKGRYASITHDEENLVLFATDRNQCIFNDTINVHFLPGPEVNLGKDTAVCAKDPIGLTGGSGDSYLWNTGERTQTIQADHTGDYWVTITKLGCSLTDSIHVQLNDPAALKINSVTHSDITCYGAENGTILIAASGDGRDFYYSIDDGATYFDNDGVFDHVGPGTSYIVKVAEDSACFARNGDLIEISQPDTLAVKFCALAPSCKGCIDGSIDLTLSGGTAPYEIRMNGILQDSMNLKNLGIGRYVFVITDLNNCEITDTLMLAEGTRPTIVSPVTGAVCSGAAVRLEVVNALVVEWVKPAGETGTEIVVNPIVSTVYEAKSITTDASGFLCETAVFYRVEVKPFIKPDLGEDILKCVGDTVKLDGGDFESWAWNNGMTGRNITLTEAPVNPLILSVTDSNGCTLRDTVSVQFSSHPAIELGNDQSVCSTNPVVLYGGPGDSYIWYSDMLAAEMHTPELQVVESGKYFLTITQNGCSSLDSVRVQFLNPDSFSITSVDITDNSCFGGTEGSIEIKMNGSATSYQYSIDNGVTYQHENLFENLAAGESYRIRIFADSLCYKDYQSTVVIAQPDSIEIKKQLRSPGCETCSDGKLTLKISGGTPPYQITLGGAPVGLVTETLSLGSYSVEVTDANGCVKTLDFVLDFRNVVPNVITTNGDGVNDLWTIPMLEYWPDAVVKVFSARGKLVFESKPGYPEPWNGKDQGNFLPMGTYYYLINLGPGEKQMNGYLTILR